MCDRRFFPGLLVFSLLLASSLSGCIAFNGECDAPPDLVDPDRTIGYLAADIPVTESLVRTQEMAIGNLITDAFASAYNEKANPSFRDTVSPVVGAIENAGGIREEGFCAPVEVLPGDADDPPPLRRADLREVMPFTNRVVVVELTAAELTEIFEHSVSALGDPDDPARGFFLHVSGTVQVDVDCGGTAQEVVDGRISVVGTRVKAIRLDGTAIDPSDTTTLYRIATNDFLLRPDGNDGFVTLAGRPGFNSLGRLDVEVVEDYLDLRSSPVAPFAPQLGGRLNLVGCK